MEEWTAASTENGEEVCYDKTRGSLPGRWNSTGEVSEAGKGMNSREQREARGIEWALLGVYQSVLQEFILA